MTLRYIAGNFTIVGASPDGDSVRFTPTDLDAFIKAGINVRANATGGVQLRLDAIDALETHYTPPYGHAWSQPAEYGDGAAAALLELFGFSDVQRDEHKTVTSAIPDQISGYILTGFADKYGRAVATVYPGERSGDAPDGALVYLDIPELLQSVNYQLLAAGLVYPTFYSQLYFDLRGALADAAVAARQATAGLWADDSTLTGFTLASREQLINEYVILPKLFRRLAEYLTLDQTGGCDLAGFPAFLQALADQLYTLPSGQMTHLDALVSCEGQTLKMTLPPEQIIFIEA